MSRCRIAVIASGSGSNMGAIADACTSGEIPGEIVLTLSNRPGAGVLERAGQRGIASACIDHSLYPDRSAFEQVLLETLAPARPDLVVLAGFMRVLTGTFIGAFSDCLLNIHPSLLPKYPGLHTHQRALDAGDSFAGATVHFVTEELDGGPAVIQARVPVAEQDSAETLAARVLRYEHRIYPLAVRWFAEGRLRLGQDGAYLDGERLPASGYVFDDALA